MSQPFPRLRPLDSFPVEEDGEVRFVLRDPQEIQEGSLLVSPIVYFIAVHLDGRRGPAEIQEAFARQFESRILPAEAVLKVVSLLDEHFLLDNDRFARRARELAAEYRALEVRAAAHAGSVYPDSPGGLRKLLEGHFLLKDGPGPPDGTGKGTLVGLVAPHIDFARGGPAYAWAYREVLSREMADLYVLLGVAHASPPSPFVLTEKDYDTPLGAARTDKELARALAEDLDWDPFEHEIFHRREHSLEFQAAYLRYCAVRRDDAQPRILPVLVSGLAAGGDPVDPESQAPQADSFLRALASRLRKRPGRTCLVAGVDLAHIGPRFGDDFEVTPEKIGWMEAEDRLGLERVLELDAAGWYRSVVKDGRNERKVCGLGALYAFCRLLRELSPGAKGSLHQYAHAPDPAGGEVSFASLSFAV